MIWDVLCDFTPGTSGSPVGEASSDDLIMCHRFPSWVFHCRQRLPLLIRRPSAAALLCRFRDRWDCVQRWLRRQRGYQRSSWVNRV